MPILYEYHGIIVKFFSNDHHPIHVHGQYQEFESKAEIVFDNGIAHITIKNVSGKKPLPNAQLHDFKILVEKYANEIADSWADFFIRGIKTPMKSIKRTIKL
ncbi:MAG: DUF4160 domain-containing protein [Candidatus Kapaibacteriota bacterium]|jgi:hypothetical protein